MRRMLSLRSLCLIAALLASPALLQAQVAYKWTDANGVVHYSDQPPAEGIRAERISVRAPAAASQGEDEGASQAEAKEENAACTTARQNLQVFETYQVIRMDLDGDGEAEELTPEQREREMARTRELVRTLCEGP